MRTLVSTKHGAVINFLACRQLLARVDEYWLSRQEVPHGAFVFALVAHLFAQDFAHQPGDARALFGGVNTYPRGGLGIERDGDVLHGADNTRVLCIYPPLL